MEKAGETPSIMLIIINRILLPWCHYSRLHWVKDVIFDEDKSPQRAGNAPINLSIIKTWVLSVFRIHGFESIKAAIDQVSHNIPAMSVLLF